MNLFVSLKEFLPAHRLQRWLIVFYLIGLLSFAGYKTFKHPSLEKYVKGSDTEGYYQYLPVFFLQDWHNFRTLPWAKPYGEGKTLSVFTCGTAILQAPFFGIAHVITTVSGLPATGYGPVYYFFVFLAGLFYASLGLYFLCKSLVRNFDPYIALLTTSLIFFGTNLFYYTIMSPGMSHVYSFFLISLFLYQIPFFYDKSDFGSILKVSVPIALAILIRPTNSVALVFFLFYNVRKFGDLIPGRLSLQKIMYAVTIMGITVFLVFIPQFLYWHYVTGHWIVYSYQDAIFSNWKTPQFLVVLFGKRGGWYVYTPLMLMASVSLLWMVLKKVVNASAILVTMIIIIYLDASWIAPTFSASAGYRALIEFLPFMAIPLAYLIREGFLTRNKKISITLSIILILLVLYNVQFAFKYDATVWWDWEWNYRTMLRLLTL